MLKLIRRYWRLRKIAKAQFKQAESILDDYLKGVSETHWREK